MVNKFIGIGNLGKDPEIRTIESGKLATFSIAFTEKWKDKSGEKKDKTTWLNCVVFGQQAEIIEEYVKKGDKLYIEGKVAIDQYDKDGVTMYATKIVVQSFTMLGNKSDSEQSGQPQSNQSIPPAMQQRNQPVYEDDSDGHLPF